MYCGYNGVEGQQLDGRDNMSGLLDHLSACRDMLEDLERLRAAEELAVSCMEDCPMRENDERELSCWFCGSPEGEEHEDSCPVKRYAEACV